MPMIRAVIFDMDGVLINSVESAARVRSRAMLDYGVDLTELPDPHGQNHKGSSLKELVAGAKQYYGITIPFDELATKVSDGMRDDLIAHRATADPYLVKLLDELSEHGIKLGIATAGVRQGAHNKLQILGIELRFEAIVTADDAVNHKPHPELYQTTMARLGVKPTETIVIEDSIAGVQSGIAAGATVVGFTGYSSDKSPLEGTTTTINSWEEIDYDKLNKLTKRR